MFLPETKIAVDEYVAELIALHTKTAGSLGANQAVGDMVTAPPSVLYTNWSLWRNVILGVSALALIGVLARLNFSSSKPTQCLTILAIGPLPFEGQQLFMDHLVRLSNQSMDYWRVYVVSGSEASIDTVVTRLDSVDIRSNLLPVVTRVQGVISLMQYRSLFIESIAQLKRAKKDKLNPTLMILGNLPEPTHEDSSRAMEEFGRTGRPFRVHDLSFTIKWWRDENIDPPYVMRYRRASSRDEQLVNDFATSDIMLTPKAIDLW
ncbi:MAG: hypothetical protein IPM83_03500 [Ignavibacteria bacterium]|nr:hypothetical protein [Ignavibacteria bacterium]